MLRNRLLRTFTLLSGVATAYGGGYDLRGTVRDSLERHLATGDLPDCPGESVNLFYNLNITIEEACPDGNKNCTGICTDSDFINIGFLLSNITAEVEEEYPKFSNEFLDTKVCVVPYVSYDGDTTEITVIDQKQQLPPWLGGKRNLASTTKPKTPAPTPAPKKKGRYTYTSGGRCRVCKTDNADRRVLATSKPLSQKEVAAEACGFAESATTADEVAQSARSSSAKVLTEVKLLATEYDDVAVAQQYVKNVTEIDNDIKVLAAKVKAAMDDADEFCDLAKAATTSLSKTQEYSLQASKQAETAASYAKEIQEEYRSIIKAKLGLKKLLLEQSFEIQKKELEDLVNIERANTEMMEKEMDNQIQLAEDQLKLTQNNVTAKELEERKEMLVQMKQEKEAKVKKMQEETQKMELMYKEQLEYEITVANILLEMEAAGSVSEWLQKFGELLAQTIPRGLYERYAKSTVKPSGCLLSPPKVTVIIQEKESFAETSRKCKTVAK